MKPKMYELQCKLLKGAYIGDCIGDSYEGVSTKGNATSLDFS